MGFEAGRGRDGSRRKFGDQLMGDLTGKGIDERNGAIRACHCEDLACQTTKPLLAPGRVNLSR